MSLLNLPSELLLMIADRSDSQSDINCLVRVNRHLWEVVNLHLYQCNIAHCEGEGLNWAAANDLPNSARYFIHAGICHKIEHWDRMPLILASQLGKVPVLSTLLKAGASPNFHQQERLGDTSPASLGKRFQREIIALSPASPLSLASAGGFELAVKLLIRHGADVNYKIEGEFLTPLHMAARYGHDSIISLLLCHGADTEATSNYSRRPLDCAFHSGQINAFRLLIPKSARLQSSDLFNLLPYWEFLAAVMETDTESTINVNYQIDDKPILHIAATQGLRESANILIQRGADIEAEDYKGMTSLHSSVSRGQKNVVDLLLELGADFTKRDQKGNTPLHHVADNHRMCDSSKKAIATALIQRGADIEARNNYRETPLCHAVRNRSEAITKLLIENEADIEPRNRRGETPFICAVRKQTPNVTRLLIEKGCDTKVKNNKGRTAMDIASRQTNISMLRLLLTNANANARFSSGQRA
ncbi:Velvet factor [Penicillium atrosanguineum]|uniref:Uncharacterized protein n=1 Tax=Penicillium atrosanguineum TaxID=1132637 RepID=A0A9W9QFN4_9EURO|nr:Velvet factor [Penicillium atrosanguineum]KAJ5314176.1 Velvet factor [Penicillium atrosanguineum]KAJ5331343.1 hypothetical protein N7476_001126 [Penicillium atrosanguineum]